MLPAEVVRPDPPAPDGVENGRLPMSMLETMPFGTAGRLDHMGLLDAREAFVDMAEAMWVDTGRRLTYTGWYRSYSAQVTLFLARHQNTPVPGRPIKVWEGKQWWLRAGMANANIPGTSNHGWGLAGDLAIGTPQAAGSLTSTDVDWLIVNAHRFGFWAENPAEEWHWVFHPPTSMEDDIMFRLVRPAGYYDIGCLGGDSFHAVDPDVVNDLVDHNLVVGMTPGARNYDQAATVLLPKTWEQVIGKAPSSPRPAGEV